MKSHSQPRPSHRVNFARIGFVPLAIALILPLLFESSLSAQAGYPPPGWRQNDPNPNPAQYPPQYSQPPAYQPSYAQPAPAPQYSQQLYPDASQQPDNSAGYGQTQPTQQHLNTEQLEQLVAPIALYPDTLVAQVLAAATYPAQVVDADHWRQAQGYVSPDSIVAGANAQTWDPSIKALTAFPQILAELDQNLRWTIALGNAYYNQPQDVLDIVQVMRQRAQAAGNLHNTPQESVTYDQGYIQLAPVNPEVVYLPVYDPWTAYGQSIAPYRGFFLGGALGSFFSSSFGPGAVRFGLGIALSAFTHSSFGWLGWGLDWLTHSLLFHNSSYYSHSTTVADWGLPHGGPRAFGRETMLARQPNHPFRTQGNYDRPGGNAFAHPQAGNSARYGDSRSFAQSRGPQNSYPQNNYRPDSNRGYLSPQNSYARPQTEASNRFQPQGGNPIARPSQPYGRSYSGSAFGGSGFAGAQRGGYPSRPAQAYAAPQQTFRAPAPAFPRSDYGRRSSAFEGSRGFESGKAEKLGGSHMFGGGHEMKAPKAPKPPKMDKRSGGGSHAEKGGHGGSHRR